MKTAILIILTIIIIISILILIYITLYNKILFLKTKISEANEVITNELNIRYEIILSLKKVIEKNTKMDISIFQELENQKKATTSSYEFDDKINKSILTINLIKEDYPKLNEKKDFKEALRKIDESNNKIEAAKSFYNKNNSTLTKLSKKFPSNIITKINKIKISPNYSAKEVFNEEDDLIKI